jgi:ABC-type transport system substrate-binding protein/DNA-binding SARP family transcriptional activator/outer membrane protein assembly factor BamB
MDGGGPRSPRLEVKLLGPVEMTIGGQRVEVRRRLQRALLAVLALDVNRVHSTDQLIDALWGEEPPQSASVALYGLVSALRKLLEPDSVDALRTREHGYVLELPAEDVDSGEFELLAAEGRRALAAGDAALASTKLAEALRLWRGPPLHDLSSFRFAQDAIGRLEEMRLAAEEARIDADLAQGRAGELVAELESLIAAHPLRERLRAQLMLALYRAGRQADALAVYREARAALVDGLAIEPSAELQELERAILRQDPALSQKSAPQEEAADPVERPRRRRVWPVAAGAAVAGVIAAGVLAVTRDAKPQSLRVPANGVGVIEDGAVVSAGALGKPPSDMAAGADSLWVTSADEQTLSRVDPETGDVRGTIPVGSGATAVAADDAAVWVANSLAGTVERIDPRAERVVQTITLHGAPSAIALRRGIVWVANRDRGTVSRFNARTGAQVGREAAVGPSTTALAVGAGGLWVADEDRGVVLHLDQRRLTLLDTIPVGNGPVDLAVDGHSVWVANNIDGTVSRIDAVRGVEVARVAVGDGPRGLAPTADGIWVSNEFDGTLVLIDRRSNTPRRTLQVGQQPGGLAAAGGRLFVGVRAAGAARRGGTLRAVAPGPGPRSFDTLSYDAAPTTILTNDGLVGFRRVGGIDGLQLVPDLALALPKPTDGGRTYTFRVRPGVRYSNGRLVGARDFRRAVERILTTPRVDPFVKAYFAGIVGAEPCEPAPGRCDLSRGVVTDERTRTVTFHLRAPDPDFLYKLALPFAFAVPPDTPARDVGRRHPLPATGPYMLRHIDRTSVTFVRNPYFHEWSKAAQPDGNPARIVVTAIDSRERAVREVERGKSDLALLGVPPDLQHEVQTQYASQVHVNPLSRVTYLFMNTRVAPFDDARVRRAVSYAVDRAAASRASAVFVGAEPACQILPPDFPGYQPYCPYTLHPGARRWSAPDLSRARRLVAASGTRGMAVTVWEAQRQRGEARVATAALRSLGYHARTKPVSDAYYRSPHGPFSHRSRVQAGLFGWTADLPAASNFFGILFSCRMPNASRFCDRKIDRQIERALALQSTDSYLATRLWSRIDRAVVDEAPVAALYTPNSVDFVSRRVGNFQYNPQWGVLLGQLSLR